MALIINTGLTSVDGGAVESGAFVTFSTSFPNRGYQYNVGLMIFRSQEAADAGYSPIKVVEFPESFFTIKLTLEEFAELTPLVIHEQVKEILGQYVGVENIEIDV